MNDLLSKKCIPCEGNEIPLTRKQAEMLMPQVPGWNLETDTLLAREFDFKDFAGAMFFVNKVAQRAEEEGHHPDIFIHGWNHVRITLSTHAIKGLSGNDFIMAAKIHKAFEEFNNA